MIRRPDHLQARGRKPVQRAEQQQEMQSPKEPLLEVPQPGRQVWEARVVWVALASPA